MNETTLKLIEVSAAESIPAMMETLAVAVREYDALTAEIEPLQRRSAACREALQELNLEIPVGQQPVTVAYSALEAEIMQRKLTPLVVKRQTLESIGVFSNRGPLIGKKAMACSLAEDGSAQSAVTGKIQSFDLNPMHGGRLSLHGRRGRLHILGPLVDRQNDYQSAYSVALL